jgi:hypothetical protein
MEIMCQYTNWIQLFPLEWCAFVKAVMKVSGTVKEEELSDFLKAVMQDITNCSSFLSLINTIA